MRVARLVTSVIALIAAMPFGAMAAAPAVNKIELRRIPQKLATRRVLDQIADLLSPASTLHGDARQRLLFDLFRIVAPDSVLAAPGPLYAADDGDVRQALRRLAASAGFVPDPAASPHPRFPLHEYTLETPYRASPYAGLCVSASFTVLFDPVGKEHGPATPVRAAGAETSFQYHLLDARAAPSARKASADERAHAERACAALDPRSDAGASFFAPDDRDAIEETWLARAVIMEAGRSPLPFTLDCGGDDAAKCAAEIARLPPVGIWLDGCETRIGNARQCTVGAAGMGLVITVNPADPLHVLHVEKTETVVVADERAD